MIKLENVTLPSPEQMQFVIQGMRNPFNSWDKSDSYITHIEDNETMQTADFEHFIGDNDLALMKRLANAGTDHRKFMRMLPIMVRITANHTFWSEFDTYKVGTVRNSCSKMHKIHSVEFDVDMFDTEGIKAVNKEKPMLMTQFKTYIDVLEWLRTNYNKTKDKKYWRALIEMLPMGYRITANVSLNYEVLANMYHSRKSHKLDEWKEFCKWVETLPYSELITRS